MIAFFPTIYPNELLYSQIARYYQKSGYARYIFAAQDLYKNGISVLPSFDFVNQYTTDAIKWITLHESFELVAEKHTMYPYYLRFLPQSRKIEAIGGIFNCSGNWKKLMCLPINNEKRYARYCPVCVEEDRILLGKTYWHRKHQISRIRICPKHYCFLENSEIILSSKNSPGLYDAESNISMILKKRICNSKLEIDFTQYIIDVMQIPIDLNNSIPIGRFLHSRLPRNYINSSGLSRNITELYQDYLDFFGKDIPTMQQSYMQKIFNGHIHDTYFILQIAYFLGISVQEITHLPTDTYSNEFQELYQELSKKHNIDYAIVENIASTVMKFSNQKTRVSQKTGPRAILYDELDTHYLPQVKNIVQQMLSSDGRPQKLSFAKIQKSLNLPQKQLNKLPQCKAYIENHIESQPEFWAREVEWAISVLMQENRPITRSRIMKMTNMRTNDIECCCPHIKNKEIQALVQSLLSSQTIATM